MLDIFLATMSKIWRELFEAKSKDVKLIEDLTELQIKYLEKRSNEWG